jgi:hypothetical protein
MIKKHEIQIFDNLLSFKERAFLYKAGLNSRYTLGPAGSPILENMAIYAFSSMFNEDELKTHPIFNIIRNNSKLTEIINQYNIDKAWYNLSAQSEINFIHTHYQDKILLYYVNLEWHNDWLGETVFYKENGTDIDTFMQYTPGRFILFDGDHPHVVRPHKGVQYRFSFAIALNKKD